MDKIMQSRMDRGFYKYQQEYEQKVVINCVNGSEIEYVMGKMEKDYKLLSTLLF